MPDTNGPSKKIRRWTLREAADAGQLVKLLCTYCRTMKRFTASDVHRLCGDLTLYQFPERFRCENCGKKDYLIADFEAHYGPNVGKVKIRRLVRIKIIHKPIWDDDVI